MAVFSQLLLDLHDELVVDLFAGGGGASTGIEAALGRQVDVAVNHDAAAVAMHRANHPQTRHHQSDVFEVCPREVTGGRPVGLMWMSPDCTFHSKARGAKPIRDREKRRRALAWVGLRWAGQARPRVIMLENVEEFAHWCPLVAKRDRKTGRVLKTDGTVAAPGERVPVEEQQLVPDPRRRGETFRKWVRALERLGYAVEWRELRACDYGAPTIRKRLFVVARCDGRPIVWPEPTHGDPKGVEVRARRLKPFRTAAECIDWSEPICSIFATREEARAFKEAHGLPGTPVRPLAEATMRRIARGVVRYVLENPDPFLVTLNHSGGEHRPRGLDEPVRTLTAARDAHALVSPTLVPHVTKFHEGSTGHGADEPLHTVTAGAGAARPSTGNALGLVAATMVQTGYGERDGQAPRALDAQAPLGTAVGSQKHGLVTAHIQRDFGQSVGHGAEEPMGTITGGSNGHAALVSTFLSQHNDGFYTGTGREMEAPAPTVCASGSPQSLVAATMAKLRGTSHDAPADGPLHAVSAQGQHHAVVAAHLTHNYTSNTNGGQGDLGEPIKTITGGQHAGLVACRVAAFLAKYYGQGDGQRVDEPAHTVTTVDRFGLVTVTIGGQPFVITDIGMRMLQPHELYRANGFPRSYVIGHGLDEHGNRVAFTKTQQVLMCGNAVPPQFSAALASANVPELAVHRSPAETERIAA